MLRRRLDRAEAEHTTQLEAFIMFSLQQQDQISVWQEMVRNFEKDPAQPNPYAATVKGLTEAEVRLKFAAEEAEDDARGVPSIHKVSPSTFVVAGLDVEDEQRRLRVQVELKKANTTAQQIELIPLRTKLNRNITRLRALQATYSPASIRALAEREAPIDERPENVPLFLPSGLTRDQREGGGCFPGLEIIEDDMHDAQCRSALVRLRGQLHIKSCLLTYKRSQLRHQGPNTQSRTLVNRNESKIRLHSEKYQMAWAAKHSLANGDTTRVGWRILKKEDIRCMEDAEKLSGEAQKQAARVERRRLREAELRLAGEMPPLAPDEDDNVKGTSGTDTDLEEALRIEWAKSFARVRRWNEDVRLLNEEQRRYPISMEARASEWDKRAADVPTGTIPFTDAEGMVAYAAKQAATFWDITKCGAVTFSEPVLGKGHKRPRAPRGDEMDVDRELENEGGEVGGPDDSSDDYEEDGEDEELKAELDDLWGDIVSNEEYVLGGGADDDD
ncbi:hypothetical protein C8J57DRAFT_1521244 [Mycena rebaudengoi]|nr:hypothetical protein C8J57DRAFT_1521244 [Mycena rebaudengoi]